MKRTDFNKKINAYHEDKKIKTLKGYEKTSLLFILLWKVGISIKPPIFMSNFKIVTIHSIFLWFLVSIIMIPVLSIMPQGSFNLKTCIGLFLCGIIYGFINILFFRKAKGQIQIKSWEQY
ncbi:hypothetical protein A9Q84_16980 [Halobacteriovorax marinus]|uniref:Uncharacterized protein n=1 Tax=Halobacteriovorax marinus TaxID=97084 RepID=A0A1Y5F3J4_9BACT|nr:hypothetical protein A9Q84_16980 [Halobacteriovorax marinus]